MAHLPKEILHHLFIVHKMPLISSIWTVGRKSNFLESPAVMVDQLLLFYEKLVRIFVFYAFRFHDA